MWLEVSSIISAINTEYQTNQVDPAIGNTAARPITNLIVRKKTITTIPQTIDTDQATTLIAQTDGTFATAHSQFYTHVYTYSCDHLSFPSKHKCTITINISE